MEESIVVRILDEIRKIDHRIDDIIKASKITLDPYESDNIEQISAALAKAQGEYAPIVASSLMKGKLKDYKYDDLGELFRVITPTLSAHGLSIHVIRKNADGAVVLHVKLRHETGQWMETRMRIPSNNDTLHEYESMITFHKRSMIKDILGCHPIGEDDDGQEAMKRLWSTKDKGTDIKMQTETEFKGPIYEPVTKAQLDELHEELKGFEDVVPEILKTYSIRTLSDMDTKDWTSSCRRIRYLKALRSGAMK